MNITILLIIVLTILTLANFCYLLFFYRKSKKGVRIEEKENYFKLDAKIELYKFMAIAVISVATFFGYTRFEKLNSDLERIDNIVEEFKEITEQYDSLIIVTEQLGKELKLIESKKNEIDMAISMQNERIQAVTKEIPEENIRVLTKQLVFLNMRNAGERNLMISEPDKEEVEKELIKSLEILKSAGFSENDIRTILNDLKDEYPWVDIENLRN